MKIKEPIIPNLLQKCFFACFIILAGMIAMFAVDYYFTVERFKPANHIIWLLGLVFIILLIYFAMTRIEHKTIPKWCILIIVPLIIFTVSLGLRLMVFNIIDTDTLQVSDFMMAYLNAGKSIPTQEQYYVMFSNWGMYSFYLKCIFSVFGYSEFVGIVANMVLTSFSSILIYLIVLNSKLKNSFSIGVLAASIFVFWPSDYLYTVLLTPEYVHIFCILLSVFLLELAVYKLHGYYKLSVLLLSSALLALSGFFKSVHVIMLIAIGVLLVLYFLRFLSKKEKFDFKKSIPVVVFLIGFQAFNFVSYQFLDFYIGQPVMHSPTVHYLNIGLNSISRGNWHPDVSSIYPQACIDTNFNSDEINQIVTDRIIGDIETNKHLTPTFFYNKQLTTWSAQDSGFAEATFTESIYTDQSQQTQVHAFLQSYWVIITILVFSFALWAYKQPLNNLTFICALVIFGFALLMCISETQTRYKVVLYPYFSILSAVSISNIFSRNKKVETCCEKHYE